jgi:uncharacterized protein YbjT (DUF2867 family)
LLRPPQIANVQKYFKPLIQTAKEIGVEHIIFLSVQGAEKNSFIPHHKIEKLIVETKIPYTFLRPAYFMQNFLGNLNHDLVEKKKIFLPAGNAKFTIVDVRDIGELSAQIITNLAKHINKSYELTNNQKLTFLEMSNQLSEGLQKKISYESPNIFEFFLVKRKEKIAVSFILIMIMLHFLPRFQKEPNITNTIKEITKNDPITFSKFVTDHKDLLVKPE